MALVNSPPSDLWWKDFSKLKISNLVSSASLSSLLLIFPLSDRRVEDFWSISCECETDDPDERNGKLITRFRSGWTHSHLTDSDLLTLLSWDRGRLYDQLACFIFYELCVEGQIATVTDCKSRLVTLPSCAGKIKP
jgi:hypothetical protein